MVVFISSVLHCFYLIVDYAFFHGFRAGLHFYAPASWLGGHWDRFGYPIICLLIVLYSSIERTMSG